MDLLQINPADNVAVAVLPLREGQRIAVSEALITLLQDVPLGAKIALRQIGPGEKIIKFGEPIGSSTDGILAGEYVHLHNLRSDYIPTASREA